MANNYLQFSESIDNLDAGDVEWMREHLGFFAKYQLQCEEEDLDTEGHPEFAEFKQRCEMYGLDWDAEDLDFQWEIEEQTGGLYSLWVYAEESGNVDQVATFVQQFFKERRHGGDECFHLSFSMSCSKPRIGEFGGGAAFVTAKKIDWMNTYDWIDKKRKEFKSNG